MFSKNKSKLRNIEVTKISPNPNQPRREFDEQSLLELAASIKEYGILQPITLRKVAKGYELIAGERRLRACELIGLELIPAIIMESDNAGSACLALIENLQRQDLSFLEEAEGYHHLIEHFGLTQEQVAAKVGKSQSAIANKLRLLRLDSKVQTALSKAKLTERHARALLKLTDSELQLDAIASISARSLNVKQSEHFIEEILIAEKAADHIKAQSNRNLSAKKMVTHTLKRAIEILKTSGIIAELETSDNEFRVLIKETPKAMPQN